MGNKSNITARSTDSSTAITPNLTTKSATTTTPSISTAKPITTIAATITTPSVATTTTAKPITTIAAAIHTNATTAKTTTSVAGTTATTTTTAATTTTPTPAITSTTPTPKSTSTTTTTPAPSENTPKPTFFSVTMAATTDANKTKSPASSAYPRWYKWGKFEQQKRDKGKSLWYMGPPVTSTDTPSTTTTTLTMTTARIGSAPKETPDTSDITVMPSYQLRSTAVYSPPHGDRVLSGRSELVNTDTTVFKYYVPDNRSKQLTGIHTKATMYQMNTHQKQTPLPTQSSSSTNSNGNPDITGNTSSLPTFVSRGLQTDFETQSANPSSTEIRYYEKQQPQIVPLSTFSNKNSTNNGFFHLTQADSQPVLPPIEKTPVWINDQPRPSPVQPAPSYRPPPTSILKKPSTGLPQDVSNPLSEQTHDQVLEELRKRNKNVKDGTYRVKKVHLLEKGDLNEPSSTVSFNLPPTTPRTKASQSILRSEKLFSG